MRLGGVARDCQYGVGHLLMPVELSHVAPGNDARGDNQPQMENLVPFLTSRRTVPSVSPVPQAT